MKKFIGFIALVLTFGIISCEKGPDCFRGNGDEVTEVRQPGEFDEIWIQDKFEVHIVKSNEYKLEFTAGEGVIRKLTSKVNNRVLTVGNDNRCNFVRGYKRIHKLTIFTPHVNLIVNEGVGVTTVDEEFSQDSISVRVASSGDFHLNGTYRVIKSSSNGNGDMYIKGKAQKLYVYTNGINYVETRELKVKDYMFIHSVTFGDCHVNADSTNKFDYNIQSDGNIYFSGSPKKIQDFSEPGAKGKLIEE